MNNTAIYHSKLCYLFQIAFNVLCTIYCITLVNQPPVFKSTPRSRDILEGMDLQVVCEAWGKPMPTVSWYKDGKVVKPDRKTRLNNEENREDLTCTSTISAKGVDVKRHDGKYLVEAQNVAGKVQHEFLLNGMMVL